MVDAVSIRMVFGNQSLVIMCRLYINTLHRLVVQLHDTIKKTNHTKMDKSTANPARWCQHRYMTSEKVKRGPQERGSRGTGARSRA